MESIVAKNQVEILTVEILILKNQTAANIIEIGNRLIKAKEMLPHGEWGKWLQEKVEFSERTARRFMRVAREFRNRSPVADLEPSKVFMLLDMPEHERENILQKPQIIPSTGEAKKLRDAITGLESRLKELVTKKLQIVEVEKIVEVESPAFRAKSVRHPKGFSTGGVVASIFANSTAASRRRALSRPIPDNCSNSVWLTLTNPRIPSFSRAVSVSSGILPSRAAKIPAKPSFLSVVPTAYSVICSLIVCATVFFIKHGRRPSGPRPILSFLNWV